MRSLPPDLAAKWRAGVTTLARAWRLTRQDGMVVAATEHDRDLVAFGTLFKASLSLTESPSEAELSLHPGHAALSGALSLEGVTADDLKLGLWDQTRVEAFLIDWQAPEDAVPLWSGFVQMIFCHGTGFELNIQTLEPALDRVLGRIYQRTCDASLGDRRCGVDLSQTGFTARGRVSTVQSDRALTLELTQSLDLAACQGGLVEIMTGRARGLSRLVQHVEPQGTLAVVHLAQPMPILPAPDDQLVLGLGCDKRFETCQTRFANSLNFRGFPTLPGEGAVVSGPNAAGNLGGKR